MHCTTFWNEDFEKSKIIFKRNKSAPNAMGCTNLGKVIIVESGIN